MAVIRGLASFGPAASRQASSQAGGSVFNSLSGSARNLQNELACNSLSGSARNSVSGSACDSVNGSACDSVNGSARNSVNESARNWKSAPELCISRSGKQVLSGVLAVLLSVFLSTACSQSNKTADSGSAGKDNASQKQKSGDDNTEGNILSADGGALDDTAAANGASADSNSSNANSPNANSDKVPAAESVAKAGGAPAGTDSASAGGAASGSAKGLNINLNDLPSSTPICSVANHQITVGDYKRMLRIELAQANQAIMMNPQAKLQLIQEATKRGITLTDEEKKRLINAAHQQKGQSPKDFQNFLKQANATEQQFDNEVVLSGLAFKTSNLIIEETLLSELVNRQLLAQASIEAGSEKDAMNKYLAFKHTKNYDQVLKETSLSPESLKDEMLKAELAKIQLQKIESKVKVDNSDIKKIYEANKAQLKHGDRIRMSTILIICPQQDIGPISGVRTQLAQANPKLSASELDAEVARVFGRAEQKALDLLNEAKKPGVDFARLANENSQEPLTASKKNGGDMGYVEQKDIIPTLAKEVWKLKPGEILPQVVRSPLGFNIYKVVAKEGAGTYKFDEVKDKLEIIAKQMKLQEALNSWIQERRKVVKVEFSPRFLAIANQTVKGANIK